jgi:hypothetical protein
VDANKWPEERMSPEVKGGRGPLLAAAILHILGGIVLASSVADTASSSLREAFQTDASFNVCLGVVFFGLWAWAKSNPLRASVSGVALFLVVQTVVTLLNPQNLVFGLIAKSLLLFFLIRAVFAARTASAWDKIEGRKQG